MDKLFLVLKAQLRAFTAVSKLFHFLIINTQSPLAVGVGHVVMVE